MNDKNRKAMFASKIGKAQRAGFIRQNWNTKNRDQRFDLVEAVDTDNQYGNVYPTGDFEKLPVSLQDKLIDFVPKYDGFWIKENRKHQQSLINSAIREKNQQNRFRGLSDKQLHKQADDIEYKKRGIELDRSIATSKGNSTIPKLQRMQKRINHMDKHIHERKFEVIDRKYRKHKGKQVIYPYGSTGLM